MSNSADRKWGNLQGTMNWAFSAFGSSSILLGIGTLTFLVGLLRYILGEATIQEATILFSITSVTWTLALIYSVRAIYYVNLAQLQNDTKTAIGNIPITSQPPPPHQPQTMETWPVGWTQAMKDAYTIAQQNNPSQRTESPEEWARKFYK